MFFGVGAVGRQSIVGKRGVQGASLDLGFMSPGVLDPRITFTRASTATYFDSTGTMQTAATNAPRWDYNPSTHALNGLLIEETRTNLLLNSATLVTQSVTTTAVATTLSFYGTGTVTKSGTATGALVGTGATQRVSQTFTPTAGTLTLTVTGTVTNAQLEAGAFVTSWIPTTAASVTRAADVCSMLTGAWASSVAYTVQSEAIVSFTSNTNVAGLWVLNGSGTGTQNRSIGRVNVGNIVQSVVRSSNVTSVNSPEVAAVAANVVFKFGGSLIAGKYMSCLNGATPYSNTTSIVVPLGLDTLMIGNVDGTQQLDGWMRRISYWPRGLTNAELQSVTT